MENTLRQALTKEYMAGLDAIGFQISSRLSMGYAGARKSGAKGNAMEFADFREYTHGDDIRRIDWNSFSRLDKLFIKLFNEEKQAVINIFLDKSKSMDFGEGVLHKFYFAKLFAASISYLALANADKVNIFCCDQHITLQKNNISSKNLFSTLVQFLDSVEPSGLTSLNTAIADASNSQLGRGISFVVSDFFSTDGFENGLKLLRNRKQNVILIHVLTPEEIKPTLSNAVRLTDMETGAFEDMYVNTDLLHKYEETFAAYRQELTKLCERSGARYLFAPTDSNMLRLVASPSLV